MSTPGLPPNPHLLYMRHGDTRPEAGELQGLVTQIEETLERPYSRLMLADLLIDLAMQQPKQADQGLERAEDALRSVIDDTEQMQHDGFNQEYRPFVEYAPSAALRLGELPSWREASRTDQIGTNYEGFTVRAFQACRFLPLGHTAAIGILAEGVPILLGHRAQALYGTGWLSRLSLAREDRRIRPAKGLNPNWDVGVASDTTASSYDNPAQKFQIKIRETEGGKTNYERSGIAFWSARSLGFDAADHVIQSCMRELDPDAIDSSVDTSNFLTPDQLDDLTSRLAEAISLHANSEPSSP